MNLLCIVGILSGKSYPKSVRRLLKLPFSDASSTLNPPVNDCHVVPDKPVTWVETIKSSGSICSLLGVLKPFIAPQDPKRNTYFLSDLYKPPFFTIHSPHYIWRCKLLD
eukprot:UN04553